MPSPPKRKSTTHLVSSSEFKSSVQFPSSAVTSNSLLKATKHTLETLPDNTVLVHATNCLGEWGAGVAKAIAKIWPAANDVYVAHCKHAVKDQLEGTCLMVPPQKEDNNSPTKKPKVWIACLFTSYGYGRPTKKKAGKDSKAKIVDYTGQALEDLRKQLEAFEEQGSGEGAAIKVDRDVENGPEGKSRQRKRKRIHDDEDAPKDEDSEAKVQELVSKGNVGNAIRGPLVPSMTIYSPRFNSGSFGVPWDQTRAAIMDIFKNWNGEWFILSPP